MQQNDTSETVDGQEAPITVPLEVDGSVSPKLYVGIGASAGGLEALCDFFDALPADTGCSFIIVQHLSPDFKSLMDELLSKHTEMPVENVVDGVKVQANAVYLMPARKNLTLIEGRLYLTDQVLNQGVSLPIDLFFRSLADSALEKSVAIVLSGTGSDGSRGIKSIKESGGLILVQDPDTAKFDGMPNSTVMTGLADFNLSPADIAQNLASYANHPNIAGDSNLVSSSRFEQEADVLRRIFELLKKEGHIDFSLYKASTVARRIEQRIGINQLHSLREYLDLLEDSSKEVQTLGRELLINVTRFFRDAEAYKFVEERVVSRIVQRAVAGQEIRVWSAGCSTGQEAYSLAILFDEAIRKSDKHIRLKIFATDVDIEAINEASTAVFSKDMAYEVSPERLERYFTSVHDGYELRSDLRQSVVFAHHNMISDPPFSNIDFISCRNVLIYFQHNAQKKVLSAFHFSLKPDSCVFFGTSESIGELKSHFKAVHERSRVYKKISNVKLPLGAMVKTPSNPQGTQRLGIPPITGLLRNYRVSKNPESSFDHVKDSLINNNVGAGIVLNAEFETVHVYGDAVRFMNALTPGRISTRIQDMILPELTVALDTALTRARSEGTPVYYTHIPVVIEAVQISVNMQIQYFDPVKEGVGYYSVTLNEASVDAPGNRNQLPSVDIGEQTSQRIRDLENDILHKKEHLQVTNEELETTNEELQSANEELMSSNEELQSTNEELQSVNEELFTVNSEFQEKISELTLANDDLDNVLLSTSVGILFLDDEIRIRKITDVARRFFNVLPTDVGRPLDHISHDLKYPEFFDDIRRVVITHESVFREVFSIAGEFVQVKLVPYRSSDESSRKGCTVTITDLSKRKMSDIELAKKIARKKEASEHRSTRDGTGLMALIVDDVENDRNALQRNLEDINSIAIEVLTASSIDQAINHLERYDVDVCLLSQELEEAVRSKFVQQIKDHQLSVPLIMMSDKSGNDLLMMQGSEKGLLVINKSEINPSVLELTIKKALGSTVDEIDLS